MNNEKTWFYSALGIIVLGFLIVGLANYVLDPYGLFRKDFSWQFVEPNNDFIKPRYVTEHPLRYDCFVFGSSRANNIDVRKIKGYSCYNMFCNGEVPHEHLGNLKYMLKKGVKIRLVLVQLDDFSFRTDPAQRLNDPLRHPYPPVLNQHLLPYYLRYLFSLHAQHIMSPVIEGYWGKIMGKKDTRVGYYDVTNTGQILVPGVDKQIEENADAHRKDPRFTEKIEGATGDNMKGTINDLTQMVRLLKAHGIRSIFFMSPPYKTWFVDLDMDAFSRFERELAKLTDFYDFSGINSITKDPLNYYNPSHFRVPIGDMMLARILGDKTVRVPSDFGVLVTSKDVEAHLRDLRQQVAEEESIRTLTPK
ncbi:MAG TPA: hypothetical protein VKF36_15645 [Syntrophorhabdales bacterium]|nr:hypothetical protein [Syntrophorhabdales bacterium]